jgi:DNA-binding XRE family transcriptional regulator
MPKSLVAKKIQEIRIHKGLNKSQMAKAIGVSSQLYGKYEEGDILPKIDFYLKFEKKFDINLLSDDKLNLRRCEQCVEKERTIFALQLAIDAMQINMQLLLEKNKTIANKNSSMQSGL